MTSVTAGNYKDLWEKWGNDKNAEAADQLVEAYLPLVRYHVGRISAGLPRNVNREEVMSHGLMGLFDAINKFDFSRELKFDTYASFRIRGAIIDGLRQEDWLPRTMREKAKKIEESVERLEQQYGRFVTEEEISEELGMDKHEVQRIVSETFFANILSIDDESQEYEKEETYRANLVDNTAITPEEEAVKKDTFKELASMIDQLNEREKLVVSLFYYEELTLTEIGQVLNLSTSRISQIHSKAILRLKQILQKKEK
ncbi:FliA/WhiG family RNA polymerase sigma factor [Bacillus sp. FJAT-44742]|uniref:FliA/WhiG family RNA polymerase sigma factor n=1 Tax=Bacillus sp. FJAT-44742 TaxID=2014005 RepID=UPI000C244111|nr:FliA/WhiG family RNA polymerase sigma factor [Bacillus sp. FJAT-44742]